MCDVIFRETPIPNPCGGLQCIRQCITCQCAMKRIRGGVCTVALIETGSSLLLDWSDSMRIGESDFGVWTVLVYCMERVMWRMRADLQRGDRILFQTLSRPADYWTADCWFFSVTVYVWQAGLSVIRIRGCRCNKWIRDWSLWNFWTQPECNSAQVCEAVLLDAVVRYQQWSLNQPMHSLTQWMMSGLCAEINRSSIWPCQWVGKIDMLFRGAKSRSDLKSVLSIRTLIRQIWWGFY